MTEVNEKLELVKEYLSKRINRNREAAEKYRSAGNYQHALVAEAQASEADCALAYLLGVMYEE